MHAYYPMCGCSSCCEIEARARRTAEAVESATGDVVASLLPCADFVADALAGDPHLWEPAVAAALASGDDAEAGRIMRREVSRFARICIQRRCDLYRITPMEAARQLIASYARPAAGRPAA